MIRFKQAKIKLRDPFTGEFTETDGIVAIEDEGFGIVHRGGGVTVVLTMANQGFAWFENMTTAKKFIDLLLANPAPTAWPESYEAAKDLPDDSKAALQAHVKYLSKLALDRAEKEMAIGKRKRLEKKALLSLKVVQKNLSPFDLHKVVSAAPDAVLIAITHLITVTKPRKEKP